MPGFGRNVFQPSSGIPLRVTFDGHPMWHTGGITLDWSVVQPVSGSPVTTNDQFTIPIGASYLRYGQVITKITAAASSTITTTGTGGTFTIAATAGNSTQTTAALAYNASTAAVLAALQALPNLGTTVTGTAGSYYAITLPTPVSTGTFAINSAALTGGSATLAGNEITVTATGGTFTITVNINNNPQTTTALAYNASLATVASAINALSNVGSPTVTGTAGSSYVITVPTSLGAASFAVGTGSLTGGTATVAASSDGNVGMWGPYDPNASDGRQNLNRGDVAIIDRTIIQNGILGFSVDNTTFIGAIAGGLLFYDRILMCQNGSGSSASLANGPTQASLEAALPRLDYGKMA